MRIRFLILALLLPFAAYGQTVVNCASGFASSGACGVSTSSGNSFWITGSPNGSTPGLSGSAVDLVPTGAVHNENSLNYQTAVNVQGFTATYTFVPNGWNIALVIQNNTVTSQGGSPPGFASGAGCEGGFFQGFPNSSSWPTNIVAINLDSNNYTNIGDSAFSYSNVQLYTTGISPCIPNDGQSPYNPENKISTSPVPLNSPASTINTTTGDTYSATISYDGSDVVLTMYDVTASGSCPGASCYTHTWTGIDIPSLVAGNTAYIGFTGGSNTASTAPLLIKSFSYTVVPPLWGNVLAASRGTDWADNAGIPGGIPSGSWTQCGSTIAAYGSSGSYASPATITNALNSCSGTSEYVLLGAGDFYLNSGIYAHGLNHVELRGSGPQQTRVHFNGSTTCQNGNGSCLIGFASTDGDYPGGPGNVYNWTGGYSQGGTSITVSNSTGVVANSTLLVLDQCDTGYSGSPCTGSAVDNGNYFQCEAGIVWSGTPYSSSYTGCSYTGPVGAERPNRGQEEIVQVSACSPSCNNAGTTTLTIYPPLRNPNWASGNTPQYWQLQPSSYVGVRGLTIDGSAMTSYPNPTTGLGFAGTSYFWATNVIFESLNNTSLFITQPASHGVIESNYVYNSGQSNPSTDNSGINYLGANMLIDNNICHNAHICIVGNGPLEGNVIAYNYMINAYTGNSVLYESIDDGHANGNDYNLYEGNIGTMVSMDQAHGVHMANTFYRNLFTGWESCANGNCGSNTEKTDNVFAIMPISGHRYLNMVANVLGTPGATNAGGSLYSYTNNEWYLGGPGDVGNVYNLGSGNTVSGSGYFGPIPQDPVVAQTLLRWGNYDVYHGSTQWNTGEVPTSPPAGVLAQSVPTAECTSSIPCPPSFYLASQPSWWSGPWPGIGPDISGGNLGQVPGTLNVAGHQSGTAAINGTSYAGNTTASAWNGQVNANPAANCFLNILGGLPDGTGGIRNFDAGLCYSSTPQAATPSFSPSSGAPPQTVTLSTSTSGASICYTTDGSTPTAPTAGTCSGGTTQTYSTAISVTVNPTTVNAIATKAAYTNSSEATASYSGATAATPTCSLASGAYPYGTSVTLSTSTSACSSDIWWSSINPPSTFTGNNSNLFHIFGNLTIYGAVLSCPSYTNSGVVTCGPYTALVGPPTAVSAGFTFQSGVTIK